MSGCYTVVRNTGDEALHAEWTAVDSLTVAPDLTISDIDYEYVPADWFEQGDHPRYRPPHVISLFVTVANIGNADFNSPYVLGYKDVYGWPRRNDGLHGINCNLEDGAISAGSSAEIKLPVEYPSDTISYSLVLLTNPVIQHDPVAEAQYNSRGLEDFPLTRELRYDNNEKSIALPNPVEIARQEKQKRQLLVGDFVIGPIGVNEQWDSLSLASTFGAPVNVVRTAGDQRANADTSVIFDFDSLTVGLGQGRISWFEVSSPGFPTHRGVRIGDSERRVRKLYGWPSPNTSLDGAGGPAGEVYRYSKDGSTLSIAFYIHDQRVYRIVIGWGA